MVNDPSIVQPMPEKFKKRLERLLTREKLERESAFPYSLRERFTRTVAELGLEFAGDHASFRHNDETIGRGVAYDRVGLRPAGSADDAPATVYYLVRATW